MRVLACLVALTSLLFAADTHDSVTLRGKLIVREGKPTAIEAPDHKMIQLTGDDSMLKVLADIRLNGFEIQAKGKFTAPDRFTLNPAHTRSLLVHKDGGLKMVTYWCDICSIRAYTPGPCACCQRETAVDLRDPDHPEH